MPLQVALFQPSVKLLFPDTYTFWLQGRRKAFTDFIVVSSPNRSLDRPSTRENCGVKEHIRHVRLPKKYLFTTRILEDIIRWLTCRSRRKRAWSVATGLFLENIDRFLDGKKKSELCFTPVLRESTGHLQVKVS